MIARRALLALAGVATAAPARAAAPPAAAPRRIVAIGGALTEAVYALGAGEALVAVDSTSLYPRAATALPQVGYLRALPPEGIFSLTPDLLLLSSDAGPPQVVDVLRSGGLNLSVIADGSGIAAVRQKIGAVGVALGRGAEAAALAETVAADWASLDAAAASIATPLPVLFIIGLGRGVPLVAACGGRNVTQGFQGFRPLSPEAAAALAPQAILLMDHTLAEAGGPAAVAALPGIALTPAAAAGRIFSVDATDLAFGPRAAQARRRLLAALHPTLALPALPPRAWAQG
ncbi:hemin ABC transporter substrate-binding protein [Roseomonas sp. 18066]|uniref:heme/hemin ABC transporter substrate-binding protein n=1 Tax=Roseomonas sp. 18066 TaxID=2681412 RepID=UPI00135999CD|nr:ABC transporter substrate-binding protein [Roseomonas sp. 18066]